ncbi:MAG: RDD family protein, partial [Paenisporosarcina sp.]
MSENTETTIPSENKSTSPIQKENVQFEMYDRFVPKPAGFWTRFWAYLIDLIVIYSVSSIFVYPLFHIFNWDFQGTTWYAPIGIITSLIFYLYFILMTMFFKQTVGKMIFGIRIVSIKQQDKLSLSTILFREWIGRFFSATIWPLYWIVGFTPSKQGLHDFIADTMVIHEQAFEKK